MSAKDPSLQLVPLTARTDIPQDARDVISSSIKDIATPLQTDVWIYRVVVMVLGLTLLATVFGGIILAIIGHGDQTVKLPDAVVAIGSAAVGALAGLLAPSPVSRS